MKHIWRYALEIFLMKKKIHLLQLFLTDVRPDEWTSGWKKKMEPGYDYHVVGTIHNFGVFKNSGKKVILQVFMI